MEHASGLPRRRLAAALALRASGPGGGVPAAIAARKPAPRFTRLKMGVLRELAFGQQLVTAAGCCPMVFMKVDARLWIRLAARGSPYALAFGGMKSGGRAAPSPKK